MKYPQRKIDVLKWLANAPRAIAVGEIPNTIHNPQVTLTALIKDQAVIESNNMYSVTNLGRELLKAFNNYELNRDHVWNGTDKCVYCGLIRLNTNNKYIMRGKVTKDIPNCLPRKSGKKPNKLTGV